MDYYIGIDSGGTKTKAVLTDACGHIISQVYGKGCNPLDVGAKTTCETIFECVSELLNSNHGTVVSMYAGIAGANHIDLKLEEQLRPLLPGTYIRTEDDRRIVLSGTIGHTNGCGMICGTGSSLSIIKENEPIRQVGGLGYLIDTCGSGYELGQAALKYSFRYLDGRGEYTILPELISQFVGKQLWSAMNDIYAGGRSYIASLAHTVFEAADAGDKVSRNIIERAADQLAELTYAAEKHFEGEFPVVMTGGIFSTYPSYCELVIKKASKRARMQMAEVPPVYGAVVEAMWQKGIPTSEAVRHTFMAELK